MIRINALLFLVLIEFTVILLTAGIFLFRRNRKVGLLYGHARKEIESLKEQIVRLNSQDKNPVAKKEDPSAIADKSKDGAEAKRKEDLQKRVKELESSLAEKNRQYEALQKQFETINSEYLILYDQKKGELT